MFEPIKVANEKANLNPCTDYAEVPVGILSPEYHINGEKGHLDRMKLIKD